MARSKKRPKPGPRSNSKKLSVRQRIKAHPFWFAAGAVIAAAAVAGLVVLTASAWNSGPHEAPEAGKILAVQAKMPFQIMIPAYLPSEIDRAAVQTKVDKSGPSGEPMVELTYSGKNDGAPHIYVREWVPGNPKRETLAASVPIKTKWGKGWLLSQEGLTAIWTDVGPTRTSVFTADTDKLSREKLLGMAESLGPPSNNQVFTFVVNQPTIKGAPPPEPFKVPVNAKGVQEFTLVITPGGYDPIRVQVKKDVPVHMTFRQLGEVGCGSELIFPSDPKSLASITLKSASDQRTLDFTPKTTGEFQFYCGHRMYRGLLFVTE